jgi:hypothetical protein
MFRRRMILPSSGFQFNLEGNVSMVLQSGGAYRSTRCYDIENHYLENFRLNKTRLKISLTGNAI